MSHPCSGAGCCPAAADERVQGRAEALRQARGLPPRRVRRMFPQGLAELQARVAQLCRVLRELLCSELGRGLRLVLGTAPACRARSCFDSKLAATEAATAVAHPCSVFPHSVQAK